MIVDTRVYRLEAAQAVYWNLEYGYVPTLGWYNLRFIDLDNAQRSYSKQYRRFEDVPWERELIARIGGEP